MKTQILGLGFAALLAGTVAVGIGCGGGQDLVFGHSGSGSTSGLGGSTQSSASSTSTSTTSTSSSTSSGTTSSSSSSASSSGMSSSSSASSSSSGNVACGSAPGDTACVTCVKGSCCSQYDACLADSGCGCWVICLEQNPGNYQKCGMQCGQLDATTQAFGACTTQSCNAECTGSGSSSSSSSGNASCSPAPGDTVCTSCLKGGCCAQYDACVNHPACGCWGTCLAQNPNNFQKCGAQCGPLDATTQGFLQCAGQTCGGKCP